MYNSVPTLPIDVKYNLVDIEGNENELPFEKKKTFYAVLTNLISMRANIHQIAGENICEAQERQRRDYNQHQNVLLKNERRMERKCSKFPFKWFRPFTVYSISKRTFCSLTNKDGTQIKIKYNVSLLKPYWDSDERKVTWDENLPPSAIDKQIYDAEKVDLLSLTDKQILIKQRIDNYAITNLPS